MYDFIGSEQQSWCSLINIIILKTKLMVSTYIFKRNIQVTFYYQIGSFSCNLQFKIKSSSEFFIQRKLKEFHEFINLEHQNNYGESNVILRIQTQLDPENHKASIFHQKHEDLKKSNNKVLNVHQTCKDFHLGRPLVCSHSSSDFPMLLWLQGKQQLTS